MCGIVGVAMPGYLTPVMKDFFQSLLLHDVVRGHHATGVAAIDTLDRSVVVQKKAIASPLFLEDKEAMDALFAPKHNFNVMIGHNRWATVGDKTKDENAHPFQHGHIVGVHNGSLRQQSLLDDHKNFAVDSDNLFYHMSKNGLDETIKKTNGAYCLVWFNTEDNTLNFIRNSERPLAIAKLTNGAYVWASEIGMLRWLIGRNKTLRVATYMDENKQEQQHLFQMIEMGHVRLEFNDKARTFKDQGNLRVVKKVEPTFHSTASWGEDYYGAGRSNSRDYGRSGGGYGGTRTVGDQPWKVYAKARLREFLPAAKYEDDNWLELRFVGNFHEASRTPGSSYKGEFSVFEYRNTQGKIITTHMFVHNGNPCKDWTEADAGKVVYGKISNVTEAGGHSYQRVVNEGSASEFTVSVVGLTEARPNRIWAYIEEGKEIKSTTIDQKEGDKGNVVPFRGATQQETTTTAGSQGTEQSQVERSSSVESFRGASISIANYKLTQGDYLDILAENMGRCADCGAPLYQKPHHSVFLFRHMDKTEGKTYDYLHCSKVCYNNTQFACDEIDKDFEKLFGTGGNDEL